jgi:peptidoglycan/LPS O-acetylase OafA/YrhL
MDTYRKDIDGLRALSVTLVVLYHAGVPWTTGGFIGVDVFFVISGYLITRQLVPPGASKIGMSIAEFYGRRARRILPSLTIVLGSLLALSCIYLLPDGEIQSAAQAAGASALFVSNIFFWRQGEDYFDNPADLQPALHTWSLSVEEQFYLFWPLLLAALLFLQKRKQIRDFPIIVFGVGLITLTSLIISIWWTHIDPVAAFLLTPSRVWELGAGAALALLPETHLQCSSKLATSLRIGGCFTILVASFIYTDRTLFPGAAAILPVLGAALVIAAGRSNSVDPIYRCLTSRPFVLTGAISYSWYLWHWPLLAVARTIDVGARNLGRDSFIVVLAYGLAYISTRYVEEPIRQRRFPLFSTNAASLASGGALIAVTAAVSIGVWMSARYKFQNAATARPESYGCLQSHGSERSPKDPCLLSEHGDTTLFLIGDSYAAHWSPAVKMLTSNAEVRAVERTFPVCPVFLLLKKDSRPGCNAYSQAAIDDIRSSALKRYTGVVLSAHWIGYLHDDESEAYLGQGLEKFLREMQEIGVRVLIVGPTPDFGYRVPRCLARRSELRCRIERSKVEQWNFRTFRMLEGVVSKSSNAQLWYAMSEFCDAAWCYPSRGGETLFLDYGHLAPVGARMAAAGLASHLLWATKSSRFATQMQN